MERRTVIREMITMTSAAYVDRARGWAKRLEDAEAPKSSAPVKAARQAVARRIGVAPGTLENLRNGRIKSIAAHLFDTLRGAVEHELQNEIARLEHDLQILRQIGADPSDGEVLSLLASRQKIREALGLDPAGVAGPDKE